MDEPGSYLHVTMQKELCKKLAQLSKENHIIYCTHSHNLLLPEVVNLANIYVCYKDKNDNSNMY